MSEDNYTDPAWDEYLSTGEDPTGGELEEQEYTPEPSRPHRPQKQPAGCGVLFFVLCVVFFAICIIAPKQREKKAAAEKKAQEEWAEYQRARRAEEQFRLDTMYDAMKRRQELEEKAIKAKEDSARRARMDAYTKEMRSKNIAYAKSATYDDGYRDGYECGHDDADCNEGYGYSRISEDLAQYYTAAYKKGFSNGYRAGFSAGREDYEYSAGI